MGRFMKLVFIGVLIIYGWSFYNYLNTPIRTDIVKQGQLKESESVSAYLIKSERLLFSNTSGSVNPIAKEGERIFKNAVVANVFKDYIDPKFQERLKSVTERIAEINNNQFKNDIFSGDIKKLELQIDNKVNELVNASLEGKVSSVAQHKEDINRILDKKFTVNGDKGPSGYNLQELIKEKESYESQLASSKASIVSDVSGVVSYHIDNLEQILTPDKINQFRPSDIQSLEDIKTGNVVAPNGGQAISKVIDNFEWYICEVISAKEQGDLKVGKKVSIIFPDFGNRTADAKVHYISQEENGKILVFFALNQHIDSIYSSRTINVEIIRNSYSGFKLPLSAIRVVDDKTGVYVERERIARFKEINILYKNNDYAIVQENNTSNGLLLYDVVITKSNDMYDGKLIR